MQLATLLPRKRVLRLFKDGTQDGRPAVGRPIRTPDDLEKIGAGEGIRTLDPDLGKVVLYH